MTTTERRLAITPGEAVVRHDADFYWVDADTDDGGTSIANTGIGVHSKDEAELIADAHNTANACDMLPSELLAKYQEAVNLLRAVDSANAEYSGIHDVTKFLSNLPR